MFGHDDDKDKNITTVNPTLNGDDSASPAEDPSVAADSTATSDADVPAPDQTDDSAVVSDSVVAATPTVDSTPSEDTSPTAAAAPDANDDHLLELKKTALEELAPLVDKLDQSAEEKFKTTMMMIQATDDSSLIASAHDAAKQITDEKVRAQALLDIVNEINYFTQDSGDK